MFIFAPSVVAWLSGGCEQSLGKGKMSQLHVNILKLLTEKKSVKLSATKVKKLKDSLKRLHEEVSGGAHESAKFFGVPLHLQEHETSSLTNGPVPHFLESITRHILKNANQEGILRKNGNERRANVLKDLMEKNNAAIPDKEYSVHDVTCVLKRWLRSLPEPVIPRILHDVFIKCVELASHHHRTQSLLLSCLLIPTFHLNTLKHVAVFLQEIANHDHKNKMNSANLAKVLAPSLMPRVVKVETDPDLAKRFSDLSTTAVQVLIDNASIIGILPTEYEGLKDSFAKLSYSDDELSDHNSDSHVKKKLFTFLKPRSGGQKPHCLRVPTTPQNNSKRQYTKTVQSCPPKVISKKRPTPPPHKKNEISFKSPALLASPEKRVLRSASRRQLSAETMGRIRERRAMQASMRSLPANSMIMTRRRTVSVRRSATVRAAMKYSCPTASTHSPKKPRQEGMDVEETKVETIITTPRIIEDEPKVVEEESVDEAKEGENEVTQSIQNLSVGRAELSEPEKEESFELKTIAFDEVDHVDNSGTCVDESDEGKRNDDEEAREEEDEFVDAVSFLDNNRKSFMEGMLNDTPKGEGPSPNSRRESVLAIRTNRAGFVMRNVAEIENTFATPMAPGPRTRRQATPAMIRMEMSTTPSFEMSLDRNNIHRKPLTPSNRRGLARRALALESKLNPAATMEV